MKKPPLPKQRVQVVRSTDLGLVQWQTSADLVKQAQKIMATDAYQTMFAVLRNESPASYGLPPTGVTHDDRVAHACRIEGYHLCLNNLEALGKLKRSNDMPEATFESEPIPPEVLAAYPEPIPD